MNNQNQLVNCSGINRSIRRRYFPPSKTEIVFLCFYSKSACTLTEQGQRPPTDQITSNILYITRMRWYGVGPIAAFLSSVSLVISNDRWTHGRGMSELHPVTNLDTALARIVADSFGGAFVAVYSQPTTVQARWIEAIVVVVEEYW